MLNWQWMQTSFERTKFYKYIIFRQVTCGFDYSKPSFTRSLNESVPHNLVTEWWRELLLQRQCQPHMCSHGPFCLRLAVSIFSLIVACDLWTRCEINLECFICIESNEEHTFFKCIVNPLRGFFPARRNRNYCRQADHMFWINLNKAWFIVIFLSSLWFCSIRKKGSR